MTTLLGEEVANRCRKFLHDKVFEKQLHDYVNRTGRKVSEMRLQDLSVLLNDLVIPWEKRTITTVELCYRSGPIESHPFAVCALKDGKPDLSTLVML